MGCGIACVASVAGISYKQALRHAKQELAWTRGYYCRELVLVLNKLGKKYVHQKVMKKNNSVLKKNGVIVFIARSPKHPFGHYVCRTTRGWMNPWINCPNMIPAKAGFHQRLPGKAQRVIFPKEHMP